MVYIYLCTFISMCMKPELEVPKNTEWQEQISHNSVPKIYFVSMCLYIIITIMLWVRSLFSFIKHYTIIILC